MARHAAGAPVRIDLSRSAHRFRIRFSDGGPGLPDSETAVAAMATSAPAASIGIDLDHGHGLGLWIIHRAVAELGGQIEMRNSFSGGLMYESWLPLS